VQQYRAAPHHDTERNNLSHTLCAWYVSKVHNIYFIECGVKSEESYILWKCGWYQRLSEQHQLAFDFPREPFRKDDVSNGPIKA
jgi:hypothetical protein